MADLDVPLHDPETVRRITETVLSRSEFSQARPSWFEEVVRIVTDFLDRMIGTVGSGGRGSVLGVVLLTAIAALVAVGLIRFGRTVRRDPSVHVTVDGPVGRSSLDWLADAERHEQAGRWRDALRCRYRALLAQLAADGLIEEVPGRTTGEYLARVSTDVPTAAQAFSDATRRFERAWYGHEPVGPTDVEDFTVTARDAVRDAGVAASGSLR